MPQIGWSEILVIILVAIIVIGPKPQWNIAEINIKKVIDLKYKLLRHLGHYIRFRYNIESNSKIGILSDCLLIDLWLSILEFKYCLIYKYFKLLLPTVIQVIKTLISLNTILNYSTNKVLCSFCILFRNLPRTFTGLCFILFRFFILSLSACMWTKDSWCW